MLLSVVLPKHHLSADTKDIVRLAMGLVATMTALVLGLLIASAKGTYDAQKNGVIATAARVVFLDRVLATYGPETAEARAVLRDIVAASFARMWPEKGSAATQLTPDTSRSAVMYDAIQKLSPQSDGQSLLKSQAFDTAVEIAQTQWLLFEQAGASVSTALLVIVIFWLAILFLSFGVFAPRNTIVVVALAVAALSVSTAMLLILELDRPFGGLIAISGEPLSKALQYLGQ
jgi:hypothetical protein